MKKLIIVLVLSITACDGKRYNGPRYFNRACDADPVVDQKECKFFASICNETANFNNGSLNIIDNEGNRKDGFKRCMEMKGYKMERVFE